MSDPQYLHGYDDAEQRRLIDQADYWSHRLILPGLTYAPGDRVLDIGCGVGAVLGVIARGCPGALLAGIDREPRQVERARAHLAALGVKGADVRVGDATRLPVYMMWFLEHVRNAAPILAEARRVLRPGGTVTITETDYSTFRVWPPSEEWETLAKAQEEYFELHGDSCAGLRAGAMLAATGFTQVRSAPAGFHFFAGEDSPGLAAHTEYVAGFLEPAVPALAELGYEEAKLRRGVEFLRRLPGLAEGAMTTIIYRATAVR
jgi:SAM-dependent methyltransferase